MVRRIGVIVVVLFMLMMLGREAMAGCCMGCVIPGKYTCASWIKGSVIGNAHSAAEEDTRGCDPDNTCPEHRQGVYGDQDADGNLCDPRPIVAGQSSKGCFFKFVYNCVSKDCVDAAGDLIIPIKKKCANQIASDPSSSHTQDGGGLFLDAFADDSCAKHNCRSLNTSVTFEFGSFNLYCPTGQVPVRAVLDSFFGFTEYCEGGRDVNGTCCRTSTRNENGTCFETYNFPYQRIVEEYCTGGTVILPGEEYTCVAADPLPPPN